MIISELLNTKNVGFVGVGGDDLSKLAHWSFLVGKDVLAFDLASNSNTQRLKEIGVTVQEGNPDSDLGVDLLVFSASLPDRIRKEIESLQAGGTVFTDTGEMYDLLLEAYETGLLDDAQSLSLTQAKINPLHTLDTSDLVVIGVTGTDGKTTTSKMIAHGLKTAGYKVGVVTTIGAEIDGVEVETGLHTTTPSSAENAQIIQELMEKGCTHLIMEMTSMALVMGRVRGLDVDYAVYTNITEEHIDYHGTYERYAAAKGLLATRHLKSDGLMVINRDDKSYTYLQGLHPRSLSYSLDSQQGADIVAEDMKLNISNSTFDLVFQDEAYGQFELNMGGVFNVSNSLAALGVLLDIGVSESILKDSMRSLPTVTGRMQILQSDPYTVIVDFAHTSNSMERLLSSTRSKMDDKQNLIVVFGCAGQRDPRKRSLMGVSASKYADTVVLTAEDPRTESLEKINDEIMSKVSESDIQKFVRFDDDSSNVKVRADAIDFALESASPGDVVMVLGKAHEKSLCFEHTEFPWNDIDYITDKLDK